jgi:hypothetical protein
MITLVVIQICQSHLRLGLIHLFSLGAIATDRILTTRSNFLKCTARILMEELIQANLLIVFHKGHVCNMRNIWLHHLIFFCALVVLNSIELSLNWFAKRFSKTLGDCILNLLSLLLLSHLFLLALLNLSLLDFPQLSKFLLESLDLFLVSRYLALH